MNQWIDLDKLDGITIFPAFFTTTDFTKENLQVGINSENSKRLDYVFPCKLSGNVEVISGDIYFGFYLG